MPSPAPASRGTTDSVRVLARRRFLLASLGLGFGSFLLSAAVAFLLGRSEIGSLTGLIFGALLQVLGVAIAGYAASALARALPLSEPAGTARRWLLSSGLAVLPTSFAASAVWMALVVRESPVLLPALPLFWGPVTATAALGLVFAARGLASERMAVLAAIGGGAAAAMALSASGSALLDPIRTLTSGRLAWDLFLVGLGFLAMALAFQRDPWVTRARRGT